MKRIINGKRYDTNTAKELASDSYSNRSDFSFWQETLYVKVTGEYFLHGEGGANTQYAQPVGVNSWRGGERIMPLTVQEAQEWAEKHLDGDEYEKIFGKVEEDKKTVAFSLDAEVVQRIAHGAAALGISKSEFVARCVMMNTEKEKTMKKWVIIDDCTTKRAAIYEKVLDARTKEEAADIARKEWDALSAHDKNDRDDFYIGYTYIDDGMVDYDSMMDIENIKV